MGGLWFVFGLIIGVLGYRVINMWRGKKGKNQGIYDLIERSRDIIYYFEVSPQYSLKYISPSIEDIIGPDTIQMILENPSILKKRIHPSDLGALQMKLTGKIDYTLPILQRWQDDHGVYRWFEEYATPVYKDGCLIAIQGVIRNIDDKVRLQEDLEYRATHDAMTGIYNRDIFEKNMKKFDREINAPVAIILCDLDDLKVINDERGHQEGDCLIQETAKLLNGFSNNHIYVTRIGGDEFALLLTHINYSETKNYIDQLLNKINTYNDSCEKMEINISLGYAFTYSSLGQMNQLFIDADRNMYEQKCTNKVEH